jgi:hypothetical protein
MLSEWLFSAAVVATGSTLFGRFEGGTPKWRRLSRWVSYLGVVALLSKTAGRPWTFVWIFGLPGVGAVFTSCGAGGTASTPSRQSPKTSTTGSGAGPASRREGADTIKYRPSVKGGRPRAGLWRLAWAAAGMVFYLVLAHVLS